MTLLALVELAVHLNTWEPHAFEHMGATCTATAIAHPLPKVAIRQLNGYQRAESASSHADLPELAQRLLHGSETALIGVSRLQNTAYCFLLCYSICKICNIVQ